MQGDSARLGANISTATRDAVIAVSNARGISYTEALRRMIAVAKLVYDAKSIGGHILIRRSDGVIERLAVE